MRIAATLLLMAFVMASGCATVRGHGRVLLGVTGGGIAGAMGGVVFSPNQESRDLNALVFGLSGALAGGLIAALTQPPPMPEKTSQSLREKEMGLTPATREFQVHPASELPAYLMERVRPAIIEEYIEADQVSDDGELHEPHKVYRIKQPTELTPRPKSGALK